MLPLVCPCGSKIGDTKVTSLKVMVLLHDAFRLCYEKLTQS